MMKKLLELIERSVILQAVITVMLIGCFVWLLAQGMPVPENLDRAVFLILGFYFGAKLAETNGRRIQKAVNQAVSETIKAYALGERLENEDA